MTINSRRVGEYGIISSASLIYYNRIGIRLQESLAAFEPSTPFYFYSEDSKPEDSIFRPIGVECRLRQIEGLQALEKEQLHNGQSVKYRIFPFYFKVLSIQQAFGELANQFDYLVWLDADCVLISPSGIEDLIDVVRQSGSRCGYFGRPHYKCAETGVIIFSTGSAKSLIDDWMHTYERIRHYSEWHDAYLFSRVVSSEDTDFCRHFNLYSNHPINELCGKWLDHQKGPRKGTGSNKFRDVYWSATKNRLRKLFR
ncbi:hypothetical protein N9Z25_06685 [Luminiphilus sp.]|nr:hypothetical protein [Luminiphilus sp.]